jgi:hypothetical protein
MLAALLACLACSGCFGGDGAGAGREGQTEWLIRYPVGFESSDRARLPRCPVRAHCRIVRYGDVPAFAKRVWVVMAYRRLACPAGPGEYGDPKAACASIEVLRAFPRAWRGVGCSDLGLLAPPRGGAATTVGTRRMIIPLDERVYCGDHAAGPSSALRALRSASGVDSLPVERVGGVSRPRGAA